jgi:ribosomal protein S14
MLRKLRQSLPAHNLTPNNSIANIRSRSFLLTRLRQRRFYKTAASLRAAMGLIQWKLSKKYAYSNRIAFRSECFITGRSRGTSKLFTVARTKIKALASTAQLPGLRKSSY